MREPTFEAIAHHAAPHASERVLCDGRAWSPRAMAAAAAAAAAGGGDGAHLTEYERQRLAHIRRNQEYMARLGLKTAAARLGAGGGGGAPSAEERKRERAEAAERRRKRKAERAALGPERRSSRLRGAKPDYTGAAVDALSDSDGSDGADAGVSFSPRRTEEDMLAETQRWLERSRAALLALGGEAAGGGCEWRAEAVRRWGKEVARAARDDDGFDWEAYVRSRMSRPPPPSPQGLLQEFYAFDQWQLLIACVLMSRVSSWNTKHSAIAAFFERWPTPSDAIVASSADLFEVMAPLGLFENRVKSVVAVTERFLGAGVFEVGLDKDVKIYGIGAFGVDSFRLFCEGDLTFTPADKTLRGFSEWQKRRVKK